MGFQKQVNLYVAPGVAGDPATPDQSIYQPMNFTAEADCEVGCFVFAGTDAETQCKPGGVALLGLARRNLSYFNYDVKSGASMKIPAGATVTVALRGDYWVKTLTAASVGQAVFASSTDGSIKTGASGADIDGYVETTWRVKTAGAANDLIVISNWADQVGAASGDISAAISAATINATQLSGTVSIENGGTGLSELGSAGQVLKVNSGGDGLEYSSDLTE